MNRCLRVCQLDLTVVFTLHRIVCDLPAIGPVVYVRSLLSLLYDDNMGTGFEVH